jgi:tetratricopeptide (TPR) repeat protein
MGSGGEAGSAACLELARLEYADGRPDAALADLEAADAWPRAAALQPEWLYWRGQSRLALKLWAPAEHDLRQLAAFWPNDAHAGAARLGAADCEAALGDDQSAAVAYDSLAVDGGPFVAQALYGLGTLYQGQGRLAEARQAYQRLRTDYPSSFEAQAVPARLAEIAALARIQAGAQAHVGVRRGRWSVQVGAYSRRRWAEDLARPLRRHRFRVKVLPKDVDGRVLYLVQVGPYASRPKAAAAAEVLHSREKLPFNLVEE